MVTAGGAPQPDARRYGPDGASADTEQLNVELFHDAHVAELPDFRGLVRAWRAENVREAFAVAQAAIESCASGTAIAVGKARGG